MRTRLPLARAGGAVVYCLGEMGDGMRDYRAVCFDFDYTLGDATESIVAGFRYGLTRLGWPDPDPRAVRATVGYLLEDAYTMLTGNRAWRAGSRAKHSGSSSTIAPTPFLQTASTRVHLYSVKYFVGSM